MFPLTNYILIVNGCILIIYYKSNIYLNTLINDDVYNNKIEKYLYTYKTDGCVI